jgi:hypothetical protein
MIFKITTLMVTILVVVIVIRSSLASRQVQQYEASLLLRNLPTDVIPVDYEINLSFRNGLSYAFGEVKILVEFCDRGELASSSGCNIFRKCLIKTKEKERDPKRTIYFHLNSCYDITGIDVRYANSIQPMNLANGHRLRVKKVIRDYDQEMVALYLAEDRPDTGYGLITVTYSDKASNFHEPKCTGNRHNEFKISFLEMKRCRDLFPCFDEPQFSAKMRVSVGTPGDGNIILTNMPKFGQSHNDQKHGRDFSMMKQRLLVIPRPMSPNKILFIAIPLDSLLNSSHHSAVAALSTWEDDDVITRSLVHNSLAWFEEYTGIKHLLGGLHMVGLANVSSDWPEIDALGISISDEKDILFHKESDPKKLIQMTLNVASRVARQWFGIMVAPVNEASLWINEGLVMYTTLRMLRERMSEFEIDINLKKWLLPQVLETDSCGKLSPIDDGDVYHSNTVRSFKGAAIFDMIEQSIVGDKQSFDQALTELVRTKTESGDGISIDDVAKTFANTKYTSDDIKNILRPWISMSGFPTIIVHPSPLDDGTICLDQIAGTCKHHSDMKLRLAVWPLPLKVKFIDGESLKSHVEDVHIMKFSENKGTVCLQVPSWFRLSSKKLVEVMSFSELTLPYFKVIYSGKLAQSVSKPEIVGAGIQSSAKAMTPSGDDFDLDQKNSAITALEHVAGFEASHDHSSSDEDYSEDDYESESRPKHVRKKQLKTRRWRPVLH